jgi:hypothetical protein
MGRIRINGEKFTARFAAGTLDRVWSVLRPRENLASFVRDAVNAALDARMADHVQGVDQDTVATTDNAAG